MANLQIALKKIFFDEIKNGEKSYEYRLYKKYWKKRLANREYDELILTCGYPKKNQDDKILRFKYVGYEIKKIAHYFFGEDPVNVYAIKIGEKIK